MAKMRLKEKIEEIYDWITEGSPRLVTNEYRALFSRW
jgi:hypothetical protein